MSQFAQYVPIRPRRHAPLFVTGALVQVFLALLLFLIVTFDSDATPLSVPAGIQLPPVAGGYDELTTIRVEASKEGFSIEGVGVELERDRKGRVTDESIRLMSSLLIRARQQNPEHDSLLLVADGRLPFEVFTPLLQSAEAAGLTRWNLLVSGAPK